ncbi:dTDP-4-dehydrorhamnose reductase [Hylemonella sp. W303a]|uniref:dTDP-4-dehydrorhamnose reductase n=1 Tax=Hylemonella sp. W303a TaxID=3389873 RepID=UPI00396B0DE0
MKILLFGKNGQVGWELMRSLAPLGDVVALDRAGADGLTGDLSDLEGLDRTARAIQPQVIVNAAAYTAVDRAETDAAAARRVNAEAPGVLARIAAQRGALLVHYSTDYVFDGSGERPWREDDTASPLSVYGRTKLEGEQAIQASGCRHLIFRTSWVYAARGGNFAKTMLRLAAEREELKVISDQIGAPTGADLIADVTAHAAYQVMHLEASVNTLGVHHLTAAGATSWFEYARFVLSHAQAHGLVQKVGPHQVQPIPSAAYSTAAQRPLNSRLDCTRLQEAFNLKLPSWQTGVRRMLEEILVEEKSR